MRTVIRTLAILLLLPASATAQVRSLQDLAKRGIDRLVSGAEIEATIRHPPALGLTAERVAFATPEGECSEDLADSLIANFVTNGLQVVNDTEMDQILARHRFSLSGMVDRESALELGKMLGPSVLIYVKVNHCSTETQHYLERDQNIFTGDPITTHYSERSGFMRGSIQVVDLTTTVIHSANAFLAETKLVKRSNGGAPPPPSIADVVGDLVLEATTQLHRLFFPWSETRRIRFFKGKDCGLKLAFQLVQAGEFRRAAEQSIANLESCQSFRGKKPKLVARAHHNLGVIKMLLGDYSGALGEFEEALRIQPASVFSEAMAECRQAGANANALSATPRAIEQTPPEFIGSDREVPPNPRPANSIEERLRELKELLDQGLIDRETFEAKRTEILADL